MCFPSLDGAVESKSEFRKSNFIILLPLHSGGSEREKEQKNIKNIKKRKNLDCHVI